MSLFFNKNHFCFKVTASLICSIFTLEQFARALDYSELTYQAKQHVEKQGVTASQFLEAMQQERDYLTRQQKVAAVLNNSVAQGQQNVAMNLFGTAFEQMQASQGAQQMVAQMQDISSRAGSGVSGFSYVRYNDGKTVWMKDNLPEKIINEVIQDKNGHKTLRDTFNMVYSEKRLLLSYQAKTTDRAGNVNTIIWKDATYSPDSVYYADEKTQAVKQLLSYTEIVTDTYNNATTARFFKDPVYEGNDLKSYTETIKDSRMPDKEVTQTFSSIVYDKDHNQKAYVKDVVETMSIDGNKVERKYKVIFSEGAYDDKKNPLHYKETTINEYGTTTLVFDGTYNRFGELISSIKKNVFNDGTFATVKFTGDYDDNGRLMRSVEATENSLQPGSVLTREFTAGVDGDYGYNKHGDITSYLEIVHDGKGSKAARKWYAAEYTPFGQLLSYKEDITDANGDVLRKSWRVLGDKPYNGLNQLASYEETTDFKRLHIVRTVNGAVYDRAGTLSRFIDTVVTTGVDALGDRVDYVKTTVRQDPGYDAGELNRYQDIINEKASDASGKVILDLATTITHIGGLEKYTEVREVTGNGLSQKITTERVSSEFDNQHRLVNYTENIIDASAPDNTTTVIRTGTQYNDVTGRAVSYTETSYATRSPQAKTIHRLLSEASDALGNTISRRERFNTADGFSYDLATTSIIVDGMGRQNSYTQVETKHYKSDVVTTTLRANILYDANNQIQSYHDIVTSNCDVLTHDISWNADSYDGLGRLQAFTQNDRVTGTDAQGVLCDYATTQKRYALTYQDGQTSSYSEDVSSTLLPDIKTHRDVTNMQYDDYSHLAEFIEVKKEQHVSDLSILNNWTTTTRLASVITAGLLRGYTEDVENKADGAAVTSKTTTVRTAIDYDDYQHINTYHDVITNSLSPLRVRTVDWCASEFDYNGNALAFIETARESGNGLDVTAVTKRLNTVYDNDQQVILLEEQVTSSASPDKVMIRKQDAITHNGLGQVTGYHESVIERVAGVDDVTTDVLRYEIGYDKFNRAQSYTQQSVSSLSPDIVDVTFWQAVSFAANNTADGYTQRDVQVLSQEVEMKNGKVVFDSAKAIQFKSGVVPSLHIDDLIARSQITFNGLGQVESYAQANTRRFLGTTEADEVTTRHVASISYYNDESMRGYIETIDDGYLKTITTRTDMGYASSGLLNKYTDNIAQSSLDGSNNTTTVNWSAIDFDKGRVRKYIQDSASRSSANGVTIEQTTNLTRENIVYSPQGFMQSYYDVMSSSSDGAASNFWNADSYDRFGRVHAYHENGTTALNGPYTNNRTGITYKTFNGINRVASYSESGSLAGNVYNRNWSLGATGYDKRGYIVDYVENGFDSSRGEYALTHRNLEFTALGQTVKYHEELTNAKGGITVTERTNTQYRNDGRLDNYTQTRTDPSGLVAEINWTVDDYDAIGRVLAYHESEYIDSYKQTTTTNWQARFTDSFNTDGLLRHYAIDKSIAVENSGFAFTQHTDWQALEANAKWQTLSYQEKSDIHADTKTTASADYALLTLEQRAAYEAMKNAGKIDLSTTVVRAKINYDEQGLLKSYTDTATASNSALKTITDWQAASYTHGLLDGYTQDVTIGTRKIHTARVITAYDTSLRLQDYTDTETEGAATAVSHTYAIGYNHLGLQDSFTCDTTRAGVASTVKRLSSSYCGTYLTGYHEQSTSSLDAALLDTQVFGIVYGNNGNTLGMITKNVRTGGDINTTTLSVQYDLKYDNNGQLFTTHEISHDLATGLSVKSGQDNIFYDSNGRVFSYTLTSERMGQMEGVVYTDRNGVVVTADSIQVMIAAAPSKTIDDFITDGSLLKQTSVNKLDNITTITRTATDYDTLGRVLSYSEEEQGDDVKTKNEVTDISYTADGHELSRVTETYRKYPAESDYLLFNKVTRNDENYDAYNRILSYTDKVEESYAGKVMTRFEINSLVYANNRLAAQTTNGYYLGSEEDIATSVRSDFVYNNLGQVTGYSDKVTQTNEDGYTISKVRDIVYDAREKQIFARKYSESHGADNSLSVSDGFNFKDKEILLGTSDDGSFYRANTVTLNDYGLIYGVPRVKSSTATSSFTNFSPNSGDSRGTVIQKQDYTYDDNGYLLDLKSSSTRLETDEYGNQVQSASNETYTVINGSPKVLSSTSTTTTRARDGALSTQNSTTDYVYADNGKLQNVFGIAKASSDDGFGNITTSDTTQSYELDAKGKPRLLQAVTTSNTKNKDSSTTHSQMTIDYKYDTAGNITNHTFGHGIQSSDDGWGNITTADITQAYEVYNKQACLIHTVTVSNTKELDLATTMSRMTTDYRYAQGSDGKWRLTDDCKAQGVSDSDDGWGNLTHSVVDQSFKIINGAARISESITKSVTENLDKTTVTGNSVTRYDYDDRGVLSLVTGRGDSSSDDGAGNKSYTLTDSTYAIIDNQVKVEKSFSRTSSINSDLSNSLSASETFYHYTDGKLSLVDTVTDGQWGTTYSYQGSALLPADFNAATFDAAFSALALVSGLDSITKTTITAQSYDLYAGKAKVRQSITRSETINADGSSSLNHSVTDYTYLDGRLNNAFSSSNGTSNDGFGNITTRTGNDTYLIIAGASKIATSTSNTNAQNLDGSTNSSSTTTYYEYDNGTNDKGILTKAWSNGVADSDDDFNNLTHSVTSQAFAIMNNKARLDISRTVSETKNYDGSNSKSDITTDYDYDANGILAKCSGKGASSFKDITGNSNAAAITQNYDILASNAKLKTSASVTEAKNDFDLTTSKTTAVTTYDYNEGGRLLRAKAQESALGKDQYGNDYTQTVTRDYVLQYGQLRQAHAYTVKDTVNAQWTKRLVDEWWANSGAGSDALMAYNAQGKLLQYHEVTNETGSGTQEKLNSSVTLDWQALSYDATTGLTAGYLQTQKVSGRNELGEAYDLTVTTNRYNIQYYKEGEVYHQGLLKGYEEAAVSSEAKDKQTYQKVTDISYADFTDAATGRVALNRTAGQKAELVTRDLSDDSVISTAAVNKTINGYDIYALADGWQEVTLVDNKSTVNTVTCLYDEFGRVVSSVASINEASRDDNGVVLNKNYTLTKENIHYNLLGFADYWTQTISGSSDAPDIATTSFVMAEYDEFGRVSLYSEEGDKYSASTDYREHYTLNKTITSYDEFGNALTWIENTSASSAPHKTVTADVTAQYYHDGSVKTQSRDITETVSDGAQIILQKNYNLTINYSSSHDRLGRALTTQMVNTNSDASMVTTLEHDAVYDVSGRKISYVEDITESIPASSVTSYTRTTNIGKFDNLGNVLRKSEITVEGAKTTIRETAADIGYDSLGRMNYEKDLVTETGSNEYGELARYSMTENSFVYDLYGRIAQATSVVSSKKSAQSEFKESSYTVTQNNHFDARGRADAFTAQEYSAIDLASGARVLLSYTETKNRIFSDTGKVAYEEIAYYSNTGELLQYETVTNEHFDVLGNADRVVIKSGNSSRAISYTYDDLSRVLTQDIEFTLNGALAVKEVTTNSKFDLQGNALKSTLIDYSYDGAWMISSLTDKARAEDSLGNVTQETVRVYSDEERAQFAGGWVTTNDYDSAVGAALGNCTKTTTIWYADKALSQTTLKKSISENTIDDRGFITRTVSTLYDSGNNARTMEVKEDSDFNGDGYAKNSTITASVYSDSNWVTTGIIEQKVELFDRNGRALTYTNINKNPEGLIKSSSVTSNYYLANTQMQIVKNYLANGSEWSKEVTASYALNAAGKPLVTTITTYNPPSYGSGVLSEKTIYSKYDALGNAVTQTTFSDGLKVTRQSSNFDIFGYAHDVTTVTAVNKVITHNESFNVLGDVVNSSSDTYLLDSADWKLAVHSVTNNSYDGQCRLISSTVDKYDNTGILLKTTKTGNNAFDAFGNATRQTITVSELDTSSNTFSQSTTITRAIETNSLGWELSYVEDIDSLVSLLKTHKEYSARAPDGTLNFNALGQALRYSETVRSYSADGVYDITTKTTRVIDGYDALGQLKSYSDTITSSSTPGLTTVDNYSDIIYDGLGRMQAYALTDTQIGTDLNLVTTTKRLSTSYDAADRVLTYTESVKSNADKVTNTITMSGILYDNAGNMSYYVQSEHKTGTAGDGSTLDTTDVTTRKVTDFDDYGRLNSYTDVITRTAANSDLNYTDTINREGTFYNEKNQVKAYRENIVSSATPDLVINNTVAGVINPLAYYMTFDELAACSGIIYDSLGRIYSQKTATHKTGGNMDYVDVSWRDSTSYNSVNQVQGYSERLEYAASGGVLTSATASDIVYDELGRLETQTTVNRRVGTGLDVTETTVRVDTKYYSNGLVESCTEDLFSSATPNLKTTVTIRPWLSNGTPLYSQYNSNGQLVAYVRDEVKTGKLDSGDELNVYSVTNRDSTTYDNRGLVLAYSEQSWSDAAYDLRTDIVSSSMDYDGKGNLYSYIRTERRWGVDSVTGTALDVTDVTTRTGTSYNPLGQADGYYETSILGAAPGVLNTTAMTNITYDTNGQMATFNRSDNQKILNGSTDLGTAATSRTYTHYNPLGQADVITENGTDKNGYAFDSTKSNIQYNVKGQMLSYSETGSREKQGYGRPAYSIARANILYNNLGQTRSYHEQGSRHFEAPNVNRDFSEDVTMTYDDKGRTASQAIDGDYTFRDGSISLQRNVYTITRNGEYHHDGYEDRICYVDDGNAKNILNEYTLYQYWYRYWNGSSFSMWQYYGASPYKNGDVITITQGNKTFTIYYNLPSTNVNASNYRNVDDSHVDKSSTTSYADVIVDYSSSTNYTYDQTTGLLSQTVARGYNYTTTSTYDNSGNLKSSTTSGTNLDGNKYSETSYYVYKSSGRILSITTTGESGTTSYSSTTTYNDDDSRTVVSHSEDTSDRENSFKKDTTTTYSATGVETSYTGTMETWGENDQASWHNYGNVTKDDHGLDKVDWYRQDVNTKGGDGGFWGIIKSVINFIGTVFPMLKGFAILINLIISVIQAAVTGNWKGLLVGVVMAVFNFSNILGDIGNAIGSAVKTLGEEVVKFVSYVATSVISAVTENIVTQLVYNGTINAAQVASTAIVAVVKAVVNYIVAVAQKAMIPKAGKATQGGVKADEQGADNSKSDGFLSKLNDFFGVDSSGSVSSGNFFGALGGRFSSNGDFGELFSFIDNKYVRMAATTGAGVVGGFVRGQMASSSGVSSQGGGNASSSGGDLGGAAANLAVSSAIRIGAYEALDAVDSDLGDMYLGDVYSSLGSESIGLCSPLSDSFNNSKSEQQSVAQTAQGLDFDSDLTLRSSAAIAGADEQYEGKMSVFDSRSDSARDALGLSSAGDDVASEYSTSIEQKMQSEPATFKTEGEMTLASEAGQYLEQFNLIITDVALVTEQAHTIGQNGLQIEVQTKVASLKQDVQNVLIKDAGLTKDSQVTMVHDFVNNETYLKFNMDVSRLDSWMGKDFTKSVSGLLDVGGIKSIEARLYFDDKGNMIDRAVIMKVNSSALIEKQAAGIAKAARVSEVTFELHTNNRFKNTMTLSINVSAAEFVKGLNEQGLGVLANNLSKTLSGNVADLSQVVNMTLVMGVKKVGGQFKTTSPDRVEFATNVGNLRNDNLKAIASALGVSELKLTTTFNNGVLGMGKTTTTFISAMQVTGDSLSDNNLKLVEEKDRDLGRMLKTVNEKLQGSVKDSRLVNIEIKTVLNKQNKMVTTLNMSTPFSNIIPGSVLDIALSGKAKLSNDGIAHFAMSSITKGQIFEIKPDVVKSDVGAIHESPKSVIASEAKQSQDKTTPMPTKPDIHPGDGMGVKPINPISPNGIMPKLPGMFFYHEMSGLNDFYQTFNAKWDMPARNSFAQSLTDSYVASHIPVMENPRFSKEGAGGVLNNVKEFITASFDLVKIDAQTREYYGDKISQFVSDMFYGTGAYIIDTLKPLSEALAQQEIRKMKETLVTKEELGIQDKYDFASARKIYEGVYSSKGGAWAAEFNIRNKYTWKMGNVFNPYSGSIYFAKGEKSYNFRFSSNMAVKELKAAKEINLVVHGYNVSPKEAGKLYTTMSRLLSQYGYFDHNTLVSWTGDVGDSFVGKLLWFNQSRQSAALSSPAFENLATYIKEINPDIRINAITHSLGGMEVLEAARRGVHFGTVIMLVPAINHKDICVGGKYAQAIKNIDKLVIISSQRQWLTFGSYSVATLGRAAGDIGVRGKVDHPDFRWIDASNAKRNIDQIVVKSHGDIYTENIIKKIRDILMEK